MSNGQGSAAPAGGARGAQRPHEREDQILYCDRCGISFFWSIEEQAQSPDAAPPTHCAGCRRLLPAADRERGLVKWYNIRKRYGFIVRQGQPEIFVPAAALRHARFLQTGDLVEFSLGANQEGPVAQAVEILQRSGPD